MKKLIETIIGVSDSESSETLKSRTSEKKKMNPLLLLLLLGASIYPISQSKEGIVKSLDSVGIYFQIIAGLILSYGIFIGYRRIKALRKLNLAGYRVWLDDERLVPEGFTHWVKTSDEAIALLKTGFVKHMSFDHDLGDEKIVGTGYLVACWVEEAAHEETLKRITWNVHSANPTGRDKMKSALSNADRFWNAQEESNRSQ